MNYRVIITCPDETKGVLAKELDALGAKNVEQKYKAVDCEVSEEIFYLMHLKLRTASRVLRVIKEFPAHDERMLFDQAKRINWPTLFGVDKTFLVEGVAADRGEEFMGSNDISKKVREGLQHVFNLKTGNIPKVDLKETDITIVAFVHKGRCVLSFDTAGKTLHKRGFRLDGHPAPIKETLAASLLLMAGYDGSQVLYDPMCGSGTIAIEGAYIALNKSPQIHRKRGEFGFELLADFNRELWRKVQEKARAERFTKPPQPIFASDINGDYIELARQIALRARVERDINFARRDFFTADPPAPSGLVVTNLPYGERIGGKRSKEGEAEAEEIKSFYSAIGDKLKKDYKGWRVALMAAESAPFKFIGLKPTRKIPILNGSIPAKLLIFDIYDGTRRFGRPEDARPLST
jgi:putative N6-adenine-specific DNA methylase